MQKIDVERCMRAMADLRVEGIPNSAERKKVIADAIAAIQADGNKALSVEYMGVKQYAGFGDQRTDCRYGFSPTHGSIVFRVERRGDRSSTLADDHVYLLECVRDFPTASEKVWDRGTYRDEYLNLCEVIERLVRARAQVDTYGGLIASATVDAHESVAA